MCLPTAGAVGQPCSWDRLVSGTEALRVVVGLTVTDLKEESPFFPKSENVSFSVVSDSLWSHGV